jgi:hypothetical protein
MHTQQIVRGAAEVLTITTLHVNDCYKRVEEGYSGEPVLRYGVVTDVMDNGPDAAVVAVEYRPAEYGTGVQVRTQVITGNKALAIFPARPDEVAAHMDAMVEAAAESERAARDTYEKATAVTAKVAALRDRMTAGTLTAPATSNIPLAAPTDDEDEDAPAEPSF